MLAGACIQPICDTDAVQLHHAGEGEFVTFGACRCHTCDFDILIRDQAAPDVAGEITSGEDHWRLVNLGSCTWLIVEDLEQPLHLITVRPGQNIVMPFELARVTAHGVALMKVFGPEPKANSSVANVCPQVSAGGLPKWLDEATAHFAVLVALCAPRLRDGWRATLPTTSEISRTLSKGGLVLTPRAVDAQIDYLVGKLGLSTVQNTGGRRPWRRECLVAAALNRGLVTERHFRRAVQLEHNHS